jgi:hypothetical protein
MMKSHVAVYAPIPMRWVFPGINEGPAEKALVRKIAALSKFAKLRTYDGKISPLVITLLPDSAADPFIASNWERPHTFFDYCFLRLTSEVTFTKRDLAPWKKGFPEVSNDQIAMWYCGSAAEALYKRWVDIAICAHIASPGRLRFDRCLLAIDGKQHQSQDGGVTSFDTAIEDAEKLGWPPIKQMPLLKVWKWLCNIPGFEDCHSKSRLGRAVGAISYMIAPRYADDDTLAVVWALLGLEALYGDSNVGMRAQLLKKSEAFLGKRLTQTKQYGAMYDFRSRLIHGDVDLPFRHNPYDATPDFEKFRNELSNTESLAVALLIASLQTMCQRNLFELNFSYRLDRGSGGRQK